jgi:hypothetical protein
MSAKSKRILALLNDPRNRNRLVGEINLLDQDEPAQVGKDQEMNALEQFQEDAVAPN